MYEIEKDKPISTKKSRRLRYPFNQMQIGDSIFVSIEDVAFSKDPNGVVSSAASAYGRRHSIKFITRTIVEQNQVTGFRVWRVD